MITTTKNISRLFPDLCAFFMGMGLVWFFSWQTTDLVWSLWLGSLTIGYLTILSTISAGIYLSYKLPGYDFESSYSKKTKNKKSNLVVSIFGALFLLPVLIAERRNVFAGFIRAGQLIKSSTVNPGSSEEENQHVKPLADLLSAPYKNVVRMHLLIFVFAFSQVLQIHTFWIFSLVYFVYFFPWKQIYQLIASPAATDP